MGIRCADHVTPLYPQKLALPLPTGGGRSVGIVRLRTKATEFMICNTFFFKMYLHVTFFYRLEFLTLLLIDIQFVLHVILIMQYCADLVCFTCIVLTCSISCWVITQCCMDQLNANKNSNSNPHCTTFSLPCFLPHRSV